MAHTENAFTQDDLPFTPETLGKMAEDVEKLRVDGLLGTDGNGAAPDAEQFYLAALSHLELAQRHFRLAQLAQSRALAQGETR